jgi:hypothetical protein
VLEVPAALCMLEVRLRTGGGLLGAPPTVCLLSCQQHLNPPPPHTLTTTTTTTTTTTSTHTHRGAASTHTCRLRTPNEWEPLAHWQDVLMWRNTIYNIVINAFRGYAEVAPQLHQLGYRDKAWSVNRWVVGVA